LRLFSDLILDTSTLLRIRIGIKRMELPNIILVILDRLHRSGFQAYVVGGAIRDIYLGRAPMDWDVATSAPVDEIKGIFHDMRYFALKHGTVTIVNNGRHFEVTPFKGPQNIPKTIISDLGRRDFTIDAMAYDVHENEILDPLDGRRDITQRTVRAAGDPTERFRRLLRAVRLATEFNFRMEPKTMAAISRMAEHLASVAQERIRDELMNILMSRRPSKGFNLMWRTGLLRQVLPELIECHLKKQNARHRFTIYKHILETIDRVAPDPIQRLCALLHDIAKPRVRTKINGEFRFIGHEKASAELAKDILTRLRFSNNMIGQVVNLISHHVIQYHSNWSDGAVRRLIRRVGPGNVEALISFREADLLAHGRGNEGLSLLSDLKKRIKKITEIPFPGETRGLAIDGHRVMAALGLQTGPEVGRVLDALMEKVMDQPELNTEEELVNLLKQAHYPDLFLDTDGH
jgi:tRNA nucleotidyltransferase (CCA-adding enzyme)